MVLLSVVERTCSKQDIHTCLLSWNCRTVCSLLSYHGRIVHGHIVFTNNSEIHPRIVKINLLEYTGSWLFIYQLGYQSQL